MTATGRVFLVARRAGELLLTGLLLPLLLPVWFLPWRAAAALGRFYGRCAFLAWPRARRVAMVNLRRAYGPAMTRSRARTAVFSILGNLGQSVAEGMQFARRHKRGEPGWEDVYEAEDPELERRILADPRPKVFATGHLGSWETAALILAIRAGPGGGAIARKVDNPFLDALVKRTRLTEPSQWIEKLGAVKEALSRLRRGDSVALLVDENGGPRGPFVEFLGRPASTRKTAALLSLTTGAPVVVGAAVRRPGRRKLLFRLAFLPPPEGRRPRPEDVLALTREIARIYEGWLREDPHQWRWIHHRWKSRPDGTEETYSRRDVASAFAEGSGTIGGRG